MNRETNHRLLEDVCGEVGCLASELRDMAVARWELARLEITEDLHSLKWMVVLLVVATVMALAALPLVAICAAFLLDGWCCIPSETWLLFFAAALLLLAVVFGCLAWFRFRRKFVGLRETIDEFREDLVWLREKKK